MALAIAALTVMAVTRVIPDPTVDALFGVILGHVGIIAYNGATAQSKPQRQELSQATIQALYAQALQAHVTTAEAAKQARTTATAPAGATAASAPGPPPAGGS